MYVHTLYKNPETSMVHFYVCIVGALGCYALSKYVKYLDGTAPIWVLGFLFVYTKLVPTMSNGLTFEASQNRFGHKKSLLRFIRGFITASVLRAMILFGDNPADKSKADVFGAMFFFFLYLQSIPLSHLLLSSFDFGISEGFFAVSMTILSHTSESHVAQIGIWLVATLVFNLGYLKYDPKVAKKIKINKK